VPDDKAKQSQLVFDDPALDWGKGGPAKGDIQAFDPRTGAGAEAYARRGARESLASKVKTTGQQSAEDIGQFAKETYGPLYEPGKTIQRNVGMWSLPYQLAGMSPRRLIGSVVGGFAGATGGGKGGHYLGGIPGRVLNDPTLEKQGAGIGEGIGAVGGGVVGAGLGGGLAGGGGGIPTSRMSLLKQLLRYLGGGAEEEGGVAAATTPSAPTSTPRGTLVVTPEQQAADVGRFYAGGGPGGGTPPGPNPYVTAANQRLLPKLRPR